MDLNNVWQNSICLFSICFIRILCHVKWIILMSYTRCLSASLVNVADSRSNGPRFESRKWLIPSSSTVLTTRMSKPEKKPSWSNTNPQYWTGHKTNLVETSNDFHRIVHLPNFCRCGCFCMSILMALFFYLKNHDWLQFSSHIQSNNTVAFEYHFENRLLSLRRTIECSPMLVNNIKDWRLPIH